VRSWPQCGAQLNRKNEAANSDSLGNRAGAQHLNILATFGVYKQEELLSLTESMGQQEKQKSRDEFAQLNFLSVRESVHGKKSGGGDRIE
jgi:hypothetical protein